MARTIQHYEATENGNRRVFVLKYLGTASTGYALFQHGDGGLNRLETPGEYGPDNDNEARKWARRLIKTVYAGPGWDVSSI